MTDLSNFSREELMELLKDAAKNWLAHDGAWFLSVEGKYGSDAAVELDTKAWAIFAESEAKRIMKRHKIPEHSGADGLVRALSFRMYALINEMEILKTSPGTVVFKMIDCRVQETRKRKNLPPFACREVGLVEFGVFAKTVDPRFEVKCISCPPEKTLEGCWCAWEFRLKDER